jgi:O-antigen ligase
MTTLERSRKSIADHGLDALFKIKGVLLGTVIVGLGILLGYLLSAPESAELTISILVILTVMLITIHKPLNGILVWLMLEPFIETWINIPMGAGIPDLSFSRFTIAFLAIFMLARAAIGKFQFARIDLADICIIATTIGIIVSAPLADNPTRTIQIAITMHLTPLAIYFFAKNLVRNKEDLHRLLLTIVTFGSVAAVYAIYEHTTGNILFLQKGTPADELLTAYTEHLWLLRGLLGRAGNFGRVLAASIPITFYLIFEGKTGTRKALLAGTLVVQAYGMFITYNRTSWYALLIGLSILPFLYPQFRKVYFIIVLVAAVGLWATWDQVNESTVVQERVNEKTEDYNGRTPRWQAGFNMWKAKPIRGWGFGRYEEESGRFRTDGDHRNFAAIENDYLHILVGSGLIGFLPYLLFLSTPLVNSLRLFFRARAPDWSGFVKPETIAIYWAVIVSFAIGSYTRMQTQPIVKMIPFALAGAVIGIHQHMLRRLKTEKHPLPTQSS